jgi:cell wall-associated NlpC family hydrolase
MTLVVGLLLAGGIAAPLALASTSWSVVSPSRTIFAGQSASLYTRSGGNARPGMRIALHQFNGRSWTAISTRTIDKHLNAAFVVRPKGTTMFRVALIGSGIVSGSVSKPIRITVSSRGVAVVAEAARHKGAPYQFGKAGPVAFDCSGFTQYVYGKFGLRLPHSARQQGGSGAYIASHGAARPGDLILFGPAGRAYHAGIFAGNGYMYDAATTGQPVAMRRIYTNAFVVRRLV